MKTVSSGELSTQVVADLKLVKLRQEFSDTDTGIFYLDYDDLPALIDLLVRTLHTKRSCK